MWLLGKLFTRVICHGELRVIDASGKTHDFGAPDPARRRVTIRFTDRGTPNRIACDARLAVAEAYMDGRMIVEEGDIRDFVDLFRSNVPWDGKGDRNNGLGKGLGGIVSRIDRFNWSRRSQRNVARHYDLSDRLYDLFLDADRQYSCAYWTDPASETLEQAQAAKLAHIAAKLNLRPGLKVLDIGCGWGGMALYLHRVAGVDVLGVTLSEEQLKVARRRAAEAGVADRVKFELIDYRAIEGARFDRIVSVGMFEHVGPPQYETFFRKCRALLAEDGVMLLHTIGRLGKPGVTDRFTTKYIFPGGYNPALSEIVAASERVRLIVSDIETLRLHYAYTLDHWYDRTVAARARVEALYDARFFRMWTFYLAGAASAFRHGGLCNYQLQYIKRRAALPITRDYIGVAEDVLRGSPARAGVQSRADAAAPGAR